jgi:hypothetical protein
MKKGAGAHNNLVSPQNRFCQGDNQGGQGFYIQIYGGTGRKYPPEGRGRNRPGSRQTAIKGTLSIYQKPLYSRLYSDFNNMMGFNSKKQPYITIYIVCLKKFLIIMSHFLQICILRFKTLLCCVISDGKNGLVFFGIWV